MSKVDYYAIVVNDRTWSFVTFQAAAATMLGGTLIALCTATSVAFTGGGGASGTLAYSSALSAAICGIAYINYSSMTETRLRTIKQCRAEKGPPDVYPKKVACLAAEEVDDFVITTLRYSDWVATFPLLALKLFDLACDGPGELTSSVLTSRLVHALIAALGIIMVASGFVALIATGDFEVARTDTARSALLRWGLYGVGMCCLIGIYVLLFMASNETESVHSTEVYGFALLWLLYPVVFVLQIFNSNIVTPPRKDVLFSILDVLSKPLLAVYVAQTALKRTTGV